MERLVLSSTKKEANIIYIFATRCKGMVSEEDLLNFLSGRDLISCVVEFASNTCLTEALHNTRKKRKLNG